LVSSIIFFPLKVLFIQDVDQLFTYCAFSY